ncbi:MAG: class I SAM-dependent methyltransferase [Deltaproteobacteria bacterium]|nr:class I SAM-dependent methyltransferase [Deltaproteobacteria bacterium]
MNSKKTTLPVESCPLCGEKETSRGFMNFDRLHSLPGSFPVRECSGCSSLYLKEAPRDPGAYYPEGEYYSTYESNTSELRAKRKLIELFYSGGRNRGLLYLLLYPLRGRVQGVPDYVPGGRVLDIGCGFGLLLDLLKEAGWETHGIDISARAIELVKKKGHNGVSGELKAGHFDSGYFDAVIMSHSIEHLKSPREYLSLAHEMLRPGGQIIVLAPNARSLGFRFFGRAWAPIETPRHLFVPSPKAMTGLLKDAGFKTESLKYTGSNWSQSLDYLLNGRYRPGSFFYKPFVSLPLEALAQALNLLHLGDSFQIKARKGPSDAR